MTDKIKVLKTTTCPSLSMKSTLTYDIGIDHQKDLYLRISGNSGGGIWNKEHIPLGQFNALMTSDKQSITSRQIRDLFIGRSINTSSFAIAALIQEGLLKKSETEKNTYLSVDPSEFRKRMLSICDNSTAISEKPAKVKRSETKHHETSDIGEA